MSAQGNPDVPLIRFNNKQQQQRRSETGNVPDGVAPDGTTNTGVFSRFHSIRGEGAAVRTLFSCSVSVACLC